MGQMPFVYQNNSVKALTKYTRSSHFTLFLLQLFVMLLQSSFT